MESHLLDSDMNVDDGYAMENGKGQFGKSRKAAAPWIERCRIRENDHDWIEGWPRKRHYGDMPVSSQVALRQWAQMPHGYGFWTFGWIEAERIARFNERWHRLTAVHEEVAEALLVPVDSICLPHRESEQILRHATDMGEWHAAIGSNINDANGNHLRPLSVPSIRCPTNPRSWLASGVRRRRTRRHVRGRCGLRRRRPVHRRCMRPR